MRLRRVVIDGFMPIKHLTLSFADDTYLITGHNGAGKSTIFEAIIWCLYGVSRASVNESLINESADKAAVQVDFEYEGEPYRVRRELARKKSAKLYAWHDDNDISQGSTPATQKKIESLLKMDGDMFLTTVFFQQDNARTFVEATPARRKEILREVLALVEYERYLAEAKNRLAVISKKVMNVEGRMEVLAEEHERLNQEIVERDFDAELQAIESLRKTVDERIEKLNEVQRVKGLKIEYDRIVNERAQLNKTFMDNKPEIKRIQEWLAGSTNQLTAAKNRLGVAEAKIDKASDEAEDIKLQIDKLTAELSAYGNEHADANARLGVLRSNRDTILQNAKCPTCLADLQDEAHREKVLGDIKTAAQPFLERSHELQQLVGGLREQIDGLSRQRNTVIQSAQESREEMMKARSDLSALEDYIAQKNQDLKGLHTQSEIAERSIQDLNTRMAQIEAEIGDFDRSTENVEDEIKGLLKERDEIETRVRAVIQDKTRYETQCKRRNDITNQLENFRAETETLHGEGRIASSLVDAFGKDGIPLILTRNVLQYLQDEATGIVRALSPTITLIRFDEGDDGNHLDIMITDRDGDPRKYEMFSGGEKARINFAIRIALSKILTQRAGSSIELLMIDEGFGALDEQGLDAFVAIFPTLKQYFKQVLAITHIDRLKGSDYNMIQIRKDDELGTCTLD